MTEIDERTRTILRYYGMLQGLKGIPFGLLLFVLAAQDAGLLGDSYNCAVTLPLFLVMMVMLFVIDQYYVTKIGRIPPASRRSQIQETTIFLSAFALIVVLENWLQPSVSLLGIAVGALFFITGYTSRRYYYLPLGAVVMAASFFPWLFGVPLNDRIFGTLGMALNLTIGTVIILAGVIDHILLVRALRQLERGDSEPSKA